MKKIIISAENAQKRIDKFLAEEFFLYSRGEIVKKIKDGEVRLNGGSIKPSYRLEENDEIEIEDFSNQQKILLANSDIKLEINFENENMLVINKPAGIQVHPGSYEQNDTITNGLLAKYSELVDVHDEAPDAFLRPGIVHRLDKDTSGVMVIAKNKLAFDELKKLFKTREIAKKYVAIVEGILKEKSGIINKPLARSAGYSKQVVARKNTKTKIREAITEYVVLREFKNYSLLEVSPKTGRMHQIRVHLASLGHPVVGDFVYGSKEKKEAERQLLHASELKFVLFGKEYVFEVNVPKDFEMFVAKMEQNKK